jgi:hypothetical protein
MEQVDYRLSEEVYMSRPLGTRVYDFLLFRSNGTPLTEEHSKRLRPLASGAKLRLAIALLTMFTFSAQSIGICVCTGTCCVCTPIIIDIAGTGFHLTSAANGVVFDISGTGHPVQISWTASGSTNAFLALPASDGLIHGGKELFGGSTPQPESTEPNGFRALAFYDLPENGGNGDGVIDAHDAIFSALRLWIDANHDGITQPEELHTLPSMGVYSVSLDYWLSQKRDQYGNRFRYRGMVNVNDPNSGSDVARTIYDVGLISIDKPL